MDHDTSKPETPDEPQPQEHTPLTEKSPRDAWEHWIRVAWRTAHKRHRGDPAWVDDLAGDAVSLLWQAARSEPVRYPWSFILRCVIILELRVVRALRVARSNEAKIAAVMEDNPSPEDAFAKREDERILQKVLEQLPEKQRDCIKKRYWDELTDREIAEATSERAGCIKSCRAKAIRTLKNAIG